MGLMANGLWTFSGPKPLELSQGGLMGSGVNGQGLGLWARATYGQEEGDESLGGKVNGCFMFSKS